MQRRAKYISSSKRYKSIVSEIPRIPGFLNFDLSIFHCNFRRKTKIRAQPFTSFQFCPCLPSVIRHLILVNFIICSYFITPNLIVLFLELIFLKNNIAPNSRSIFNNFNPTIIAKQIQLFSSLIFLNILNVISFSYFLYV